MSDTSSQSEAGPSQTQAGPPESLARPSQPHVASPLLQPVPPQPQAPQPDFQAVTEHLQGLAVQFGYMPNIHALNQEARIIPTLDQIRRDIQQVRTDIGHEMQQLRVDVTHDIHQRIQDDLVIR